MPTETVDRPQGLSIGDCVAVRLPGGEVKYYHILLRDRLFYKDAHSALSAGATESYAEVSNLDPPTGQIYQIYRIKADGNVRVYIKQPAATNRFGTNKSPEQYLVDDLVDGQTVNIWVLEDYPPNIQIVNPTGVSITATFWWIGWRYAVRELKEKPPVFSWINIGGITE